MAVTFDTLKAATQLREEAGFSKRQATGLVAFANTILENVATKDDVADLRGDMEKMEAGLRGDMEKMEAGLRGDMEKMEAGLRGDMKKMEAGLRADMEKMETGLRGDMGRNGASLLGEMHKLRHQMTVRFGAGIGAAVAIIVALDKLI